MAKKMLILPGIPALKNSAYPDENGDYPEYPKGAIHRWAAEEYARRKKFEPVLSQFPGNNRSGTAGDQVKDAVTFVKGHSVEEKCALYGFSGGGYNVYWILWHLANKEPAFLHHIELVVVLGAPSEAGKARYQPSYFNPYAKKAAKPDVWVDATWDVVHGDNPSASWPLPKSVPKDKAKKIVNNEGKHMFGPEWLLDGMP